MPAPESDVVRALHKVVEQLSVGEVRTGQVQMAEAVARALAERTHVSVAAGTGTGKSFGYLVPAALSRKHVVVATATKALQDQLATKDLPIVAAGLNRKLGWAVLKGRSNYLCQQAIVELRRRGSDEQLEFGRSERSSGPAGARRHSAAARHSTAAHAGPDGPLPTDGEQVARLVAWAETTETGDRSELDFEPSVAAWSNVSVTADQCPGAPRCESGDECYAERARARAQGADITVVNHHLVGADIRSGGVVLPEYEALIVDEAHELEDILAASMGVDIGAGRLRALAVAARSALPGGSRDSAIADQIIDSAADFEAVLAAQGERRLEPGLGGDLGRVVTLLTSRLERLRSHLRESGKDGANPESAQRRLRVQLAVERCGEELTSCLAAGRDSVVWVAAGAQPHLRSAPLDVSSSFRAQIFEAMPVVLTSATMAPGLGVRLGAPVSEMTEIDVGSPFDFARNGLIYCATHLPNRRSPDAEAEVHDELALLIEAAGGRTLALFTSRRAMERATASLRERLQVPIHMQGDLPKPALVEAFTSKESSCLFATMGYWQGVDVPGTTLSLVVIEKLPFPRPDDPLMAARREAAGALGFRAVDLPRAATLLAQGAGRLIRTASDRGVVAVLDPRLATASYSGYLVKALPKMRRTRDRSEAVAFLREVTSTTQAVAEPTVSLVGEEAVSG